MIRVEALTRTYGDLTAVDQVSFEIGQGEIVGLLGHNGAGKTTIMKMLTGYLEPSSGSIEIDGLDISVARSAVQSRIGYLP
jgi:ABC-2 type transport system ATP-binding protein